MAIYGKFLTEGCEDCLSYLSLGLSTPEAEQIPVNDIQTLSYCSHRSARTDLAHPNLMIVPDNQTQDGSSRNNPYSENSGKTSSGIACKQRPGNCSLCIPLIAIASIRELRDLTRVEEDVARYQQGTGYL